MTQSHLNPQLKIPITEDTPVQQSFLENQNDKWLVTQEAADFLRISKKRLLNLTSNGLIPYYKFQRSNRYRLSELTELLQAKPKGSNHGN